MAITINSLRDKENNKFIDFDDGTPAVQVKAKLVDSEGTTISDDSLKKYSANDVDEASSTITYVGKENAAGKWLIQKIDTSSGTSISYATQENNSGYDNYTDAWTDRTSLTYGDYSEVF